MLNNIKDIEIQAKEDLAQTKDTCSIEKLRIKYLGRKGLVNQIFSNIPNLPATERQEAGRLSNELKQRITGLIQQKSEELKSNRLFSTLKEPAFDISLPGVYSPVGHKHPLTLVMEEICENFVEMGYSIVEGPEIETEYNNFTALNIPLEHPSRDVFDTFYLKSPQSTVNSPQKKTKNHRPSTIDHRPLLRSHTSPVQIRVMKSHKPPLAVVVPGKVYRPDAVDASHSFMFHQIEGFSVDVDITFADLKGTLELFARRLFGLKVKTRFRPHFFPFTEPSAEVDISCYLCKGRGCSVCAHKGWLEILGCGMINPVVFETVGYDPNRYTGFAFGMGIERIAMLKFGINDIRIFFENDMRFLRQF